MTGRLDYAFLICALLANALYWCYALAFHIGKGSHPLKNFNLLHLKFFTIFLAFSMSLMILGSISMSPPVCGNFMLGCFVYFALHYAIFMNFIVLACASVSTSILSIINQHGSCMERDALKKMYGAGHGISYVKHSRINRLKNVLGWIDEQDGCFELTRTGKLMAFATEVLLRLLGLRQIGR